MGVLLLIYGRQGVCIGTDKIAITLIVILKRVLQKSTNRDEERIFQVRTKTKTESCDKTRRRHNMSQDHIENIHGKFKISAERDEGHLI
jgi:hypothetical protein